MKRCAAIPSIALISPLKRKQMIRRRLFSVAGTDGTRRARKSGRVFRKSSGAEASIARAYYWLGGIYEKEEKKKESRREIELRGVIEDQSESEGRRRCNEASLLTHSPQPAENETGRRDSDSHLHRVKASLLRRDHSDC